MNACTIAARNYLAKVSVLAASFKAHHPGGQFTALVIDDVSAPCGDLGGDLYRVVTLGEIGLPHEEIRRMAMMYDVTEFSTAVKPWFLRHLLEKGMPEVVYFDPDIEIFAPLDDVFELARRHSIVLTPHTLHPYPRDELRLNETDILGAGMYNLGFLGLGSDYRDFLDWWSERLRRECISAPLEMRFTDQRWIDFVPSLFEHHLLKDEGCNVAYWNLHGRKVVWTGERYEVNGAPLRFFHFSGYDPAVPHLLSKHMNVSPRSLLSEHPGVARLCREYAGKLEKAGFSQSKKSGYFYDRLENGFRISPPVRRLYRDAVMAAEACSRKKFPPPCFQPGSADAFMDWLNEPVVPGFPHFTRFFQGVHALRPDLQDHFPDPINRNAADFIHWILVQGRIDYDIPDRLIPLVEPEKITHSRNPGPESAGPSHEIDVVGYFHAELGVGEAARLLISGIEAAGISFNCIPVNETSNRQEHPFAHTGVANSGAAVKILCVNGDATPSVARQLGGSFFGNSHTIGVWFWELEEFPGSMFSGFDLVDEIWVASEFIARALRKVSPKPVFTFPLPVRKLPGHPSVSRAALGLPENFLFYFSFDFNSVFERKNPLGLVRAFRNAFSEGEGPVLVLKSINGDLHVPALEKLRFAAADRSDILVMDGYLPHDHKDAMMAHCDCYISLHRGEGFGLTMAEAMVLSKPVIATRYGGNLEFMSEKNSYLCSYKRRLIGAGNEPYPAAVKWAEPDIAQAAAFMRHVYEHRDEAAARGRIACQDIAESHSLAACVRFIKERLACIRKNPVRKSDAVSTAKSRPAGEVESKAQEIMDDLQAKIKDLSSLEQELEASAHRMAMTAHSKAGGRSVFPR